MSLSTQTNKDMMSKRRSAAHRVRLICIFAMLGTLMFASKLIMEILPNIHLLGMLIAVYTSVYRSKALIPIYLFVFLTGIYAGFSAWWVPYLYVWTVLWGMVMLIPRGLSKNTSRIAYALVCALHGLAFGAIYAPGQAFMYGFDLQQTVAWIAAGFPFDVIHGVSNFFTGLLVIPFSELLRRLSYGKQER